MTSAGRPLELVNEPLKEEVIEGLAGDDAVSFCRHQKTYLLRDPVQGGLPASFHVCAYRRAFLARVFALTLRQTLPSGGGVSNDNDASIILLSRCIIAQNTAAGRTSITRFYYFYCSRASPQGRLVGKPGKNSMECESRPSVWCTPLSTFVDISSR